MPVKIAGICVFVSALSTLSAAESVLFRQFVLNS
jgi:hypothetical protein